MENETMEKLQRAKEYIRKAKIDLNRKMRMLRRLDEAIENYDRNPEERRQLDKVLMSWVELLFRR